jgi:HTH-type transcriptional regulator/antitoxin HigA
LRTVPSTGPSLPVLEFLRLETPMSSMSKNQFQPDYCVSPGEILLEALEERGLTQSDLAQRTGRPVKTINEIVQGKTSITPDTALQLERVLNIPSKFWMNLETTYQSFVARRRDRGRLEKCTGWLNEIPVGVLVKFGWIRKCRDPVAQLEEVLGFYGIASPEVWKEQWLSPKVAYRASETFVKEPGATSAWLRRGEILAQRIECESFDAKALRDSLMSLRELSLKSPEEFLEQITETCKRCGVAVIYVPSLPKAPISGATRWLTPNKALIELSFRHGTDDHFWFTLFHEIGHVLMHGKREVFIDDDFDDTEDLKEHEANDFACDILMPPKLLSVFAADRKYDKKSVRAFADQLGIATGIVVGKLQRHKLIDFDQLNDLKRPVKWTEK